MQEEKIGNLYGYTGGNFAGNVYNKNALAPAINTCQGGGREPMITDMQIVAMRGRDKDNPSDRTPGNKNLEQRLEPNSEGICNTLTTVQKDNMVLIKQATKEGYIPCKIGGGRSELSRQSNTQRKSTGKWTDMPNTDNGEYP